MGNIQEVLLDGHKALLACLRFVIRQRLCGGLCVMDVGCDGRKGYTDMEVYHTTTCKTC